MKFPQSFTCKLLIITVLITSLLAGCSTATPATPAPTQDSATVVAAAVATLSAQMTQEALRNPTSTPVPTNTSVPTDTPVPPTFTPAAPTETPTNTATTAPAISAKFLSAGTFNPSKKEYQPNERFSLAVRFLNTGTTAWEPGYRLKLVNFQGEATVQLEAELGQAIEPGKAAEFDLWAFGSETLGQHIWYFQLYSSTGLAIPGGSAVFSYKSY